MLTLYTTSGAIPLKVDDYYIKELASGLDELEFTISIWDEAYQLIQEEATIREHSGSDAPIDYLVKAIDGGRDTATVKCQIDLDAWKSTLTLDYDSGSKTISQIVSAVAPTGWAVVDQSGITYKRTIHLESATALDVLTQCRSTFATSTFRFDNIQKTVTILSMANGQNLGAFATRDLNLKENNYKGKSTGFITRLYAYGKDGLSFASINGGKEYVDNNTYSSRVICGYWKDERYTVAANLLADAQEKLAQMAVPERSYSCNVVDLAAVDPTRYGFLDFALFTVVTLIDQTRSGSKIEHRVIEHWRYPYNPEKNKVTLSTVTQRIQSQVAQAINNFNNPNSVWQQQQRSAQQNAIENATSQITGAKGGNMRAIYDANGNWTELVVMNTEDILTASKLWRFNLGGFGYSPNGYNGPYTTAITMDGAIVADFITTGTLDASLVTVTHLDASNITTGTLSADRIAANSITAGKLDIQDLSAIGATIGGWTINTTNIRKTVASTYDVCLQAPASPSANDYALFLRTYSAGSWTQQFYVKYDGSFYAKKAEIEGQITATSGVIGGVSISGGVLSNISAINMANNAITEPKIDTGAVTNTKIGTGAVTGGSGGKIASSTITTTNTSSGINTNLGWGAAYGDATASSAGAPSYFWVKTLSTTSTTASSYVSSPAYYFGSHTLGKKTCYDRDGNLIYYVSWT